MSLGDKGTLPSGKENAFKTIGKAQCLSALAHSKLNGFCSVLLQMVATRQSQTSEGTAHHAIGIDDEDVVEVDLINGCLHDVTNHTDDINAHDS